ncbi:MAG TPA: hypothetical protein ENN31_01360 [Candidatus Vogelbacteria bacterium]|nr:hypothetical protein [Candidatus Vogelbacteria bacterium]
MNRNFSQILKYISEYYGIKEADILGPSREKNIKMARFVIVYLAREILNFSYPEIGRELGDRDHTTIMHAYKKMGAFLENENFKNEIDEIINNLGIRKRHKNITKNFKITTIPIIKTKQEDISLKKSKIKIEKDYIFDKRIIKRLENVLNLWREGNTLQEVGDKLKLSRERISQLIKKGIQYEVQQLEKDGIKIDYKEYFRNEKLKQKNTRNKIKEENKPPEVPKKSKIKRWSEYYDFCRMCKTTDNKHISHGYCKKCYYKTEQFKEIQRASRLRNKEKWDIRAKKYSKEYINRPEIKEKLKRKRDEECYGGNRELALKRDGYQCTRCHISQQESLNKYGRDLYVVHIKSTTNHSLKNLITLCKKCHSKRIIKIVQSKNNKINKSDKMGDKKR